MGDNSRAGVRAIDIERLVVKDGCGNDHEGAVMAEGFILEFDGFGREHYDAVNQRLGIDQASGEGDWPAGLVFHAGGATPGGFVVFEVWESRQAQERFMSERLAKAIQDSGITAPPSRAEWLDLAAYNSPGV